MFFRLFSNKKPNSGKTGESTYTELVKYLILLISAPAKATSIIIEGRNFISQPIDYQKNEIAAVYLLFEKYCCEVDQNPLKREDFRKKVSTRYPWVKTHSHLNIIFKKDQKKASSMLCATFLKVMLGPVIDLAGTREGNRLTDQISLLSDIVNDNTTSTYQEKGLKIKSSEVTFQQLKDFSLHLFSDLSKLFGTSNIENLYNKAFEKIRSIYLDFDLFPQVIELIPPQLIRHEHLRILGVNQIQEMLSSQIEELEKLNLQLKKEAEENRLLNEILKERSSNLQKIFNGNLDAVIVVDTDNKVTYWNDQAVEIFGYNRKEALNKSLSELIIPQKLHNNHNKGMSLYLALTQQTKLHRKLEMEGLHKNGNLIPLELRLTEYSEKGNQYFISFIRDISQQKEYEAQLIKARDKAQGKSEAKSKFLTTISHEIRTPVNAILGFSDLLDDTRLDDIQQEYLLFIKSSSLTLLELINDLINLDKLNKGRLTISPRLGNLKKEIEKIISPYIFLIRQKGLEFKLIIEDALPMDLSLDYFRLGQVLTNLVSNALKFTETGGISLSLNYDLDDLGNLTLSFIVSDSGKGISEEKINAIFISHNQEDNTIAEKYGGSGLGLSISREIAEIMGGKISASSPSKFFPGRGSDFKFTIKTKLG